MLVFLSLLEWKPFMKMKMVFDLSLGIKMWDTLFYLLGECDAGASQIFLGDYFGVHGRRLSSFFQGFLVFDFLAWSWSSKWSMVSQHGLGARHGLWLFGRVFGFSAWSRNLVPIVSHVTNFL